MTAARAIFRAALLAVLLSGYAQAQDVLLERGLRMGELWVFPLAANPEQYVYVPHSARLETREDGSPVFGFTVFTYGSDSESADDDGGSPLGGVSRASGGAILRFTFLYDTPAEVLEEARAEFEEHFDEEDEPPVLSGPVIFSEGRYVLISSVIGDGDENGRRVALTEGPAPVLEGNRMTKSFMLGPEQATILQATLESATPDLSVQFEMQFTGQTEAYDADMVIDWSKAEESMAASAGGSIYFVSAKAEAVIERMLQDGSITLDVRGDDASMEALVQHVYSKALELMFEPVEPDKVPEDKKGDLLDALSGAIAGVSGGSGGGALPFTVQGSFQYKNIRSEGQARLSFNKRMSVTRRSMLTMSLGNLHAEYGDDPSYFNYVNTELDPDFLKRKIYVGLDVDLVDSFDSLVDAVQVDIRKRHGDGNTTIKEARIDRGAASADALIGPLTYNYANDGTVEEWREFEYRIDWTFRGNGRWTTPWQTSTASTIFVSPPYHEQHVFLVGDLAKLRDAGVRAMVARISYDYFGNQKTVNVQVPMSSDELPGPISLVLPEGTFDYLYHVFWILSDGGNVSASGEDSLGYLFLDTLFDIATNPENPES